MTVVTVDRDSYIAGFRDAVAQGITEAQLANAIHMIGKAGDDPEDRYLEVNSDQLAAEIVAYIIGLRR